MAKNKAEAADTLPSKMKMVEEAMAELGLDSTPGSIQPWVQEKYHTEIDKQMISSYASNIRKKLRGGGKSGAVRSGSVAIGNGSVGVKDVALLRDLIDRVGPSEVQTLIKVLTK